MRNGTSYPWLVSLLAIASLAACERPNPPPPGHAEVVFLPLDGALPNLTLTQATMHLDHIFIVGDGPPPMGPPMPGVDLDLLGSGVVDEQHAPQGLYSRVQLAFHGVTATGTWRGTPFAVHLANFGPGGMVDLRSATAQELAPEHDVSFTVTVDAGTWFAGSILDGATISGGQIACDDMSNPSLAMALTARVHDSFLLP